MSDFSEQEKEALKFLDRDFNQSFQQMRHYDAQIFDIIKFMFTGYSAVNGVALGLYEFSLKENMDLMLPAIAVLIIGLLLGIFMFALVIRDRVYFIQVTRYINEQRGLFLEYKPMGFENKSKMYTNYQQPPYFNWRSSHSWLCYIAASLNSTILGVLLYILERCLVTVFIFCLFFIIIQLMIAILYLITRENKSAAKAVFGKD